MTDSNVERDGDPSHRTEGGETGAVSSEELQVINERLVVAGVRQMELVETAQQEQRRAFAMGQEEERRRISRELHDESGQHLAGLVMGLGALEETIRAGRPGDAGAAAAIIANLRRIAEDLAQDLHRIAIQLRPTALDDHGLEEALFSYAERWSDGSGIPVDFVGFGLKGQDGRLPEIVNITVYRVVQEALTNIARYARPAGAESPATLKVSVTLQGFPDHLQATVEDNGVGFDVEAAGLSDRLGLAGMRERAATCGGTLEVESAPGEGTTIYLRVPLSAP